MEIEWRHVVTQMIGVLLMFWILKKYAWGRLYGIIDARKQRIESEFSLIENEKNDVKKLQANYKEKLSAIDEQSKAKFKDAIAEGRKVAEEIQQSTQRESDAILLKARENIQNEVLKAREMLKEEVVNLTIAASKKIIHEDLNSDKQKKMIRDFVENEI
jgi:F-type H+-transporting ATPase subunit b